MVDYLLERGANPNPAAIAHTALRAASIFGHEHVARRLLAAKADPNFCSLHGRTPLMGAAMNKHPALVRILLDAQVTRRGGRVRVGQAGERQGAKKGGRKGGKLDQRFWGTSKRAVRCRSSRSRQVKFTEEARTPRYTWYEPGHFPRKKIAWNGSFVKHNLSHEVGFALSVPFSS